MVIAVPFTGTIEFQMSVLLFASMLGYVLASRFGQSAVIGEILVGILVGPSLLGLVEYSELVRNIATLGAIFLLFVVGLETKFKEIFSLRALLIAAGGVVVPWLAGYGLALLFGYPSTVAIFVGTTLTATSIAITAHVLRELNKLDTEAARAIIGAAVVDDVLGLLALSFTAQLAASQVDVGLLARTGALAFGFLAVGLAVGVQLLRPLLERLDRWAQRARFTQATLLGAFAVAFLYSAVSEAIGLSAIVGAFLAGLSLEGFRGVGYREAAEYFERVFAAVFFVSLGVLINVPAALGALPFLLALTVVGILSKFLGCSGPALLTGLPGRDSLVVGVSMVPRGEIAMITALFGLSNNLIGQDVYSSILLMSLLTTVVAPPLLRRIYAAPARKG